jgi:hypothetical protein
MSEIMRGVCVEGDSGYIANPKLILWRELSSINYNDNF